MVCGPDATLQPVNWRVNKSLSHLTSVRLRASGALPLRGSLPHPALSQNGDQATCLLVSLFISHILGQCLSGSTPCVGCRGYNKDVFSPGLQSSAGVENQKANRSLMKQDEDMVVGLWKKQGLIW